MKKAYVQTQLILMSLAISFSISCMTWRLIINKISVIPPEHWQNMVAGNTVVSVVLACLIMLFLARLMSIRFSIMRKQSRINRRKEQLQKELQRVA